MTAQINHENFCYKITIDQIHNNSKTKNSWLLAEISKWCENNIKGQYKEAWHSCSYTYFFTNKNDADLFIKKWL